MKLLYNSGGGDQSIWIGEFQIVEMENANCGGVGKEEEEEMDLPPGFRFHPTDEELITHYLSKKVVDVNFIAKAIGEVDLNKSEPWELPWKAKMGEKEWYFFCVRDRKYPTGLRTNRATDSGYWKATGKDKEIYRGKSLVGMKKTLVFYRGRAPKGGKTNWVMHEYRLDGKFSIQNLPKTAKNEWVICRVFQKSCGGKKTHISGLVRIGSFGNEMGPSGLLPPLMDSSSSSPPYNGKPKNPSATESAAYVPCFSNSNPINVENTTDCFNNPMISNNFPRIPLPNNSFYTVAQSAPVSSSPLQFPSSILMPDQSILLRALIETHGQNLRQSFNFKTERDLVSVSQETGLTTTADINPEISSVLPNHAPSSASAGPVLVDFDSFWNY